MRRKAAIERELVSRADERVLRWFGPVRRMVLMTDISAGRVRCRSRLGWTDGVKMALDSRRMTVEAARRCLEDWKEWRVMMHILMIEFNAATFVWPCVLSDLSPSLW